MRNGYGVLKTRFYGLGRSMLPRRGGGMKLDLSRAVERILGTSAPHAPSLFNARGYAGVC